MYEYRKSIKSPDSDELINTYVIRPLAGILVGVFYRTPVTPNQVTIASIVAGFAAAWSYLLGSSHALVWAGLLVTLKDLLDSADGQLARAKQQYSRSGRFLDSIGDFFVDFAVFGAIGWMLWTKHNDPLYGLLAFAGFAGITFRVSYHVFYHTSYLHLQNTYQTNRVTEEVREEDTNEDSATVWLQRVFQALYGWQDRLILRMDRWCSNAPGVEEKNQKWYSEKVGIRLSGLLGMGTELFLLMVFSVLDKLEIYLFVNLFVMNSLLAINILYRRFILSTSIS